MKWALAEQKLTPACSTIPTWKPSSRRCQIKWAYLWDWWTRVTWGISPAFSVAPSKPEKHMPMVSTHSRRQGTWARCRARTPSWEWCRRRQPRTQPSKIQNSRTRQGAKAPPSNVRWSTRTPRAISMCDQTNRRHLRAVRVRCLSNLTSLVLGRATCPPTGCCQKREVNSRSAAARSRKNLGRSFVARRNSCCSICRAYTIRNHFKRREISPKMMPRVRSNRKVMIQWCRTIWNSPKLLQTLWS